MSQRTSGWRSALSLPGIYCLSQKLLGGTRSWLKLVKNYIKPKDGMRILDLGCGPAPILAYIPENTNYIGIDISREYIDAAKNKYGKRGDFHCMTLESLGNADLKDFDLVMGIGLLHHLNDKQAISFFDIAARALNQSGRCLTIDPCIVPGQHPLSRLLVLLDRGRNVRSPKQYAALAKPVFHHLSQDICHDWLRVPYTHHIMNCRKNQSAS
jgi:SAM-dependent methyltransferase